MGNMLNEREFKKKLILLKNIREKVITKATADYVETSFSTNLKDLYDNKLSEIIFARTLDLKNNIEFPENFDYISDDTFILNYSILKCFGFRYLDLFTLNPKCLEKLCYRLLQNPWEKKIVDNTVLNYMKYNTIVSYLNITYVSNTQKSNVYIQAFKKMIDYKKERGSNNPEIIKKVSKVINMLDELSSMHIREAIQTLDPDKRFDLELMFLDDYAKIDLYGMYYNRNDKEKLYDIYASYDTAKQKINKPLYITEMNFLVKVCKKFPINIEGNLIEDIYKDFLNFVEIYHSICPFYIRRFGKHSNRMELNPTSPLLYRKYIKKIIDGSYLEDQKKEMQKSIDQNGNKSINTIKKDALDEKETTKSIKKYSAQYLKKEQVIQEIIDRKIPNPGKYYIEHFGGVGYNEKSLLKEIHKNNEKLHDDYVEYITKTIKELYTDEYIKNYHTFVNVLKDSTKRRRVSEGRSYDQDILATMIDIFPKFSRKQFRVDIKYLQKLTETERKLLNAYYSYMTSKNMLQIEKEEDILRNLSVIKGKIISPEIKKAIIDHILEKADHLYSGVYDAMLRRFVNGSLKFEGIEFDQLEDYKR